MEKHEIALQKLMKEYIYITGKVVGDYFLRINGDDEVKKSVEVSDFMNALLMGKPLKEEWSLDKSEDFKKMNNIAESINFLKNKQQDV